MKIVYAGSDSRSPVPFRALREAGFCIAAVVTQPDKPTGRKHVLTPNPMKVAAREAGVPVYDFAKIRDHAAEFAALGADCIVAALADVAAGCARYEKQNEADATFCKKIRKEDCRIDFSQSAEAVCRLVRAMNPEPLAYTSFGGKLVNVTFALPAEGAAGACGQVVRADKTGIYVRAGEGCVRILELQFEGGKRLKAADAVNGRKVAVGDVFGADGTDGAGGAGGAEKADAEKTGSDGGAQ